MTLQELASELKQEAERRGLTNIDVGVLAGIDNSLVGKCLKGRTDVSPRNYAAIAKALGKEHLDLSVRELLPPKEKPE